MADAGEAACWAQIEDPISDDFFGFEFDFTGKKPKFLLHDLAG